MNSIVRAAAGLAIAGFTLAGVSLSAPAVADTSYPMVCRGGGGMSAQLYAGGTTYLYFAPASQGASVAPPGHGQCTWLDRALRSSEPTVLLSNDPAGARYLVENMIGGGTFYVHVYNNRAGQMQVTRIGP